MNKISILIPCYNVEKYICQCLESILNQTYTNLEIICINDGSTDTTGAIIDQYAALDYRIVVIHKANTGYGDTMNIGLNACTGDYIGIVEPDDWIEPTMYETLLNIALMNNLDYVKCLWFQGPTGTECIKRYNKISKNSVIRPLEEPEIFLIQPAIWAALYKNELLNEGDKIRFLPTPGASYQDASFYFKTLLKSTRFMMLDKAYHHYRINPGSSVCSSGKVLCLLDEWAEERCWLLRHPKQKQEIIRTQTFAKVVHGGFRWNYKRIDLDQKKMFFDACSVLFSSFVKDGLFDIDKLKDLRWGKRLILTIKEPNKFYQSFVNQEKRRLFWNKIWSILLFK